MRTDILKSHMLDFSLSELKNYLGQNLVDTMLEWMPNQEVFTKSKLAEMIVNVHGINILKNKDFKRSLIKTFNKEEIFSFREHLSPKDKSSEDLTYLCDKIAEVSWRDNLISRKILSLLNIEDDIFKIETTEQITQEILTSSDRFYELLDYQFVIKQKVLNNLNQDIELNRMLIHMPTGTGKTKTAMHTICHHFNFNLKKQGLIIWIAHTTELLQQAYDTFCAVWRHLGNGDVTTYKVWGNHEISVDNDSLNGVMFCGIQKLMSLATNKPDLLAKLISDCRLIVFDEAHKASASETKNVVEQFMVKKQGMLDRALVGLTATPGRTTQTSVETDLLVSMFGNKIIQIDTEVMNLINLSRTEARNTVPESNIIRYFQDKRILSKVQKEQLTYAEDLSSQELSQIKTTATANGYVDFTDDALKIIGRNKSRNLAIMKKLIVLYQENVPTIVFACSVEQGQLLSSMLSIENIPNAIVIGNMTPQDRIDSITAFKDRENPINILINYEVLTTGFDSTNIKCVFIARPTQSVVLYSQMLGRGLRGPLMGGNEECLLVDVKDNLEKYNEKMAFAHFDNYWKV